MGGTVVLNPGLGVGHLVPMVELAKLFLQHGLAVTVVIIEPPVKSADFAAAVARASACNPSITFKAMPTPGATATEPFVEMVELLRLMNAPFREYLRELLPSVRALVLDMFCVDALDIAAEFGIPAYFLHTSGAADLAVSLHLPYMQAKMNASFGEMGEKPISFPGVPTFKATDLPRDAHNRDNETYKRILYTFQRLPESRGILVNTFESLEVRALRAIRDGSCVPCCPTPPVYCVGPLVSGGGKRNHECLEWLDAQPDRSVVFLCFGSMGSFGKKQLEKIAVGLERSGQRFLWVVRNPGNNELPEPDLGALLPEGFLERTKDRGLTVRSWAPQVDVLSHRATAAFVTHCGWNSVLEAITTGMPMLCWPLYAEQRMNKVFIVEMGLGVEIRGHYEVAVTAEEVEAKVRWVMESEGGRALRAQVAAAKEAATEALKEGGASLAAFGHLLKDLESAHGEDRDASNPGYLGHERLKGHA